MSAIELMLDALINGESVDVDPKSKVEKYLLNCIEKCGCEDLPKPTSRVDALLYVLSDVIAHSGGGAGFVDTKKLDSMFGVCTGNKNLNFVSDENFDTSNVLYFDKAFQSCTNLVTAPVMNTSKAVSMTYMFDGCTKLKTVYELDCSACWSFYDIFNNCAALENLTIKEGTIQADIDFSDCVSLTNASLFSVLKGIKKTMGYKRLKLPASKEQTILSDTELNSEYQKVLTANWYVDFV